MKYAVKPTTKFQRDLKRIQKRGYDISLHMRYSSLPELCRMNFGDFKKTVLMLKTLICAVAISSFHWIQKENYTAKKFRHLR